MNLIGKIFFFIYFILFINNFLYSSEENPLEFTQKKVAVIKDILNKYKPEEPKRKNLIQEEVKKCFDFSELGKRAIEREKDKFTTEQMGKFLLSFANLLEKLYLKKSEKFVGDNKIDWLNFEAASNEATVYASAKNKEADFKITVKLYRKNSSWMAYDIVVDQSSLLLTYSRQFKKILKKQGAADLLLKIDSRIKSLDK